jgi:preprotein translocase subunit SecA
MVSGIEEEAVEAIFKLEPVKPERFRGVFSSVAQEFLHPEANKFEGPQDETMPSQVSPLSSGAQPQPAKSTQPHSVGRNDPCPCGSGKKYKKCCGK